MSLLWPLGATDSGCGAGVWLDKECPGDLDLAAVIGAFATDWSDRAVIERILLNPCRDPDTIRYRQDVLDDFLRQPGLASGLAALMPSIDALARFGQRVVKERTTLHEVIWRLGEVESIVECTRGLVGLFEGVGGDLRSAGLRALRDQVTRVWQDETFQHLVQELPGLLARLRSTVSVTLGVNLDQHLQPVEATILAVNDRKFKGESLLARLFGRHDETEGIAQLHSVPLRAVDGPVALPVSAELGRAVEPMLVPLFRDLALILEKAARPVAQALRHYASVNGLHLSPLRGEVPFFLGAVKMIRRLEERGLPLCRPEIAPEEERICRVRGAYNIALAVHLSADRDLTRADLSQSVVANDIVFGPEGRIYVLTGPNQGGKTTYIQAIGLVQVLAQAGLHVPGEAAAISPVDAFFTHFATAEQFERGTGRFGDEARRLHETFTRVTRNSLVLLNEALSSTNAGESLYLGQDILRVLRRLGARAIFSTHLHELAAGVEQLNAAEPGDSLIASLIASPVGPGTGAPEPSADRPVQRSYRVVAGPPMGRSYALEIARQYGVSYDQLRAMLRERGVLD